jgi:hypothetical protein
MYCHYPASSQFKFVSSQLLILKLAQNPFVSQVIDVGKDTKLKLGDVFKFTKLEEGDVFNATNVEEGDVFKFTPVNEGEVFNATNVLDIKHLSSFVFPYHNQLAVLLVAEHSVDKIEHC